MSVALEPIIGRYMTLRISGRDYRLYFEEAGRGIPLVCLHTAGADGRQFRHLMTDQAVTDRFRVLAFDMPWRGKSLPPEGWQSEEYQLTATAYMETVLAFCRGLELDRPVVMGCSIGGRIVLHLAIHHAAHFRALIGLESAAYQTPFYDRTWLHRPDLNGGEVAAAFISGLIAPQAPDVSRFETLWLYKQSGPGVFKGDLHFYREHGDLRDQIAAIDTTRCPLYLLTGEYDFSCTPEDTRQTSEAIPGAEFVPMKSLGHFPMSEHPEQFRKYILPVLDAIHATDARARR